jgi:hypothetical protein
MFNELKWEMIVRFVDIGDIADHYCLNLNILMYKIKNVEWW